MDNYMGYSVLMSVYYKEKPEYLKQSIESIQSLACGTPVVMFQTGGSPECVDEKSGIVIEKNKTEG